MSENDTTDDTKHETGPIEPRLCPYFSRKSTWSVPCLTVNCMAWSVQHSQCKIIEGYASLSDLAAQFDDLALHIRQRT